MQRQTIFVLLAMAFTIAVSATTTAEEAFLNIDENNKVESSLHRSTSTSRFLARNSRAKMTCNNYPWVCHAWGSPGPDCCRKKCVNVLRDRLNCGMCGKKCKYWETCCKGMCVNPSSNRRHCGSCNNVCEKGSSCVYGMCSYA